MSHATTGDRHHTEKIKTARPSADASSRLAPGPENPQRGIHHVTRLRQDFLGYTGQLQQQFGDCVHYRVGLVPVYQFTHPDQMQEVLVTQARSFRKTDRFRRVFRCWLGNGLLLNEGDSWSKQRQLVQPSFQPQSLPSYAKTIVSRTGELLDRYAGSEVDAASMFHKLALLTTGEILFGTDLSDVAPRFVEEVAAMQAIAYSDFTSRFAEIGELPRVREGVEFLDGVVTKIVDGRRRGETRSNRDLLDRLMQAADDSDHNGSGQSHLRDEILMLLLAGGSTTATALTWAAYTLASHPLVQGRLQDEVGRLLGGRSPTGESVKALTGLEAALFETLRLYPPAYTLSRQAIRPVEIGGYRLPAGAQVHLIPFLAHRDHRWYDDPLEFRPQRFASEHKESIPRFAFIPFGAGPRACVGGGLAMMECLLVLATIVQRCRLELADGQQQPELQPLIALQPKGGIRLRLSDRAATAVGAAT